jgi:hypothetical protein
MDDYDFTDAQRGRFYVRDAVWASPPVYLEPDVLPYLTAEAHARGASVSEVANTLLRDSIARIKSVS